MRMGLAILMLVVACGGHPETPAPDASPVPPQITVATTMMAHMARGEYDAVLAMFAKQGPTAADLAALWKEVAPEGGELIETRGTVDPADSKIVYADAQLKWGTVRATIEVVDGKVAHFMCKPIYTDPHYVDNQTHDEEVAIGSGPTALRGILTTPGGKGPWPVVLLVQGSGPSDLDEWGPGENIMPFRNLAGGLASKGVAVLRVDKVTWAHHWTAHHFDIATFTVKEEYLDPVGEAIAFLAKRFDKVFVLGHSMGGWMLPWIMKEHPEVDGGIIAAGNARNIGDLLVEQDQWLTQVNNPGVTEQQLALLRGIDEDKVRRIHDPNLAEDTDPNLLPFGSPAHGWKFVQSYDAPAVIATLDRPFLLLQGERDYNVTMVDHEMWKKALAGRSDTVAKSYPTLNHLFIEGVGKATPAELTKGGYVHESVVEDIAAWIKAR
jgi:dienelactone hydrolase